jgi:hypothetical protein
LASLIEQILEHKSFARDSFIKNCFLYAAPSKEKFQVDIRRFIIKGNNKESLPTSSTNDENETELVNNQ